MEELIESLKRRLLVQEKLFDKHRGTNKGIFVAGKVEALSQVIKELEGVNKDNDKFLKLLLDENNGSYCANKDFIEARSDQLEIFTGSKGELIQISLVEKKGKKDDNS
jgi:hypothetical protein